MRTEFAHMFFLSLLQAKGAFLRPARYVVEYGCGLPYLKSGAKDNNIEVLIQAIERRAHEKYYN
jgi:hypothetical protein